MAGYPMEANGPSCDNVSDCNNPAFGELTAKKQNVFAKL